MTTRLWLKIGLERLRLPEYSLSGIHGERSREKRVMGSCLRLSFEGTRRGLLVSPEERMGREGVIQRVKANER